MKLVVSRFRLVFSTLLLIPAIAAGAFSLPGGMTREDGMDC